MAAYTTLGSLITPAETVRCGSGKYPVLSMTMYGGIVLQRERFKKSLASIDQSDYKVVRRGQLVVGFPIDEGVLYFQEAADEGIMSPAYQVWDVNTAQIYPDFLELCLHSPQSMQYYKDKLRGTTARRRSIPTADLLALRICIPDMETQRRTVTVLNQLDLFIDKRRRQLAKLDELVNARFVEMFGDPVSNSMGWNVSLLKNVTSKIGSGATPKGGRESYPTEGITLIRSMNVHDGYFEYKDLAHLNSNQAEQLSNVEVNKDDVFINITGASVARSCIVPENVIPARVNQHVSIIRCKQSIFKPVFANQQFLNATFKKRLLELGEAGGATRQAITKRQLEELTVIVPPLDMQNLYAAFTQQVNQKKQTIRQSLDQLETLKKSLMQEYFG